MTVARAATATVTLCVVVMAIDYAFDRSRTAEYDRRIPAIQKQAQADPSQAAKVAAEHSAITKTRQARKARTKVLSILLLAAAAIYIGSAKWLIVLQGVRRRPPRKATY